MQGIQGMNGMHAQMQSMQGMHNGGGNNGMKEVMQNLSKEDRTKLQDMMKSLPEDQRSAIKEQIKSVEFTNSEDYMQSIMDIFDQATGSSDSSSSDSSLLSVYA